MANNILVQQKFKDGYVSLEDSLHKKWPATLQNKEQGQCEIGTGGHALLSSPDGRYDCRDNWHFGW
jgi:hypothetical protein